MTNPPHTRFDNSSIFWKRVPISGHRKSFMTGYRLPVGLLREGERAARVEVIRRGSGRDRPRAGAG